MNDQLYQIPNPVTSFGVTCAIGRYVMDSDDEGKDPDLVSMGGSVEITPNLKTPIRIDLDPPRIVSHDTMRFSIDPRSGELVHPDGTVGIELINTTDDLITPKGWSYTATVRPEYGASWSTTFVGPPEGATSIDLALIAPVNPNPGTVIPLDPSFYLTKDEAQRDYAKKVHTHSADEISLQNGSETTDVQTEILSQLSSIGSLDIRVTDLEQNGGGGGSSELPNTGPRDMSTVWTGETYDVTWYSCKLQRVGPFVILDFIFLASSTAATPVYDIPDGFKGPNGHTYSLITQMSLSGQTLDLKPSVLQARNRLIMAASDTDSARIGSILWFTEDPWPVTLPGSEVTL